MRSRLVIKALYQPTYFTSSRTSWYPNINDVGKLCQTEVTGGVFSLNRRTRHVVLGREKVQELLHLAEKLEFSAMNNRYIATPALDMPSCELSILHKGRGHVVTIYGASHANFEDVVAVHHFWQLWDAVHEQAPLTNLKANCR